MKLVVSKEDVYKSKLPSNLVTRVIVTKTKLDHSGNDQTKNCIDQIPCECGDFYIGKPKRSLTVRAQDHQK